MKKIILASVCFLQFFMMNLYAQSTDPASESEEYNRWSASLYGGYIFGEKDRGLQIFASRFNVVSEPSWAAGGDLRYALNSFWSIEGGYRYSALEGMGFETTLHTVSVKNTFNLNRFYRRSNLSEYLNPYVILGVEQDFFNAEGPNEEFSRNEASLMGGLGVAFRLSNRLEIFGQHEIKLSSNRLDLLDRGYPYDQIGMASGGIRIHFGSSDRKPMNLKPATRQLTDREYDDIFTRGSDEEDLTHRIDSFESQLNEIERKNSDTFNELSERIASLETRVDSLEAKTNCLCEQADRQPDVASDMELRQEVAAGHYVQVFASLEYNDAHGVREQFRELLQGDLDDPEEQVFIIQRQRYFEVLIGVFNEFENAQRILSPSARAMTDSFIITFHRPVHLKDLYEGTVIVHD